LSDISPREKKRKIEARKRRGEKPASAFREEKEKRRKRGGDVVNEL